MASTMKVNPLEKFNPEKSEFLAIAVKYNGNIKDIASHYNIHHSTAYEYINRDKAAMDIIFQVRGMNTESDLDLAEKVYRYNMANIKERPALAQRAAEKVIEGKGYLRGWKQDKNVNITSNGSPVPEWINSAEGQSKDLVNELTKT